MKTIRQMADELGVSKQAISKRLSQLPPTIATTNERGVKLINTKGEELLRKSIQPTKTRLATTLPPTDNQLPPTISENTEFYAIFKAELDAKNKLIDEQQQTINRLTIALENTTTSVQTAQLLHGGTLKNQLTDNGGVELEDLATESRSRWQRLKTAWKGD